ncbi:MAG: Uma2 family endonuclease [Microcystis wesenbergii TW10]|jgi:Uma2 family endonuclease|uniref:Uma2 family endonuclease n=3 Tax=Microcystis TaxID=1125 RepID=A0ABU3HG74_9CHRO|nr:MULTISPECIES: Uma2 family endonuclease [Microcystis]REJ49011.1 MAG: Uma2 family endonuclease [Microcystis wesenbergii TW10]MBD2118370.1 Uma2 family endonuclease [Microcystis wesenbergii FACHB-1339]MCZ8040239.1 Uma2 family endonuclease [Microcystis sp. LE17-20A]MCZ8212728.1 Uma2 family endonuclease [Microcystis sp. LE19-8.1F]MDT3673547.1 Uma2 family endonuclease [Microcystis wesenbergii NRERC-220]
MITTFIEREAEPILINDLTWREFKAVEQLIERPGLRLSFLDGVLEIRKMPGKKHETIKERIGALLEIYLEFLGLDFTPTGSVTLENEFEKVKREGDKSYELGANRKHPDLVIEVVVSSGGINKLEAYKRLQIPEVWFWMNDELLFYSLGNEGYKAVSKSQLLPSLDVGLLMRCINTENHAQALREFRAGIKIIEST